MWGPGDPQLVARVQQRAAAGRLPLVGSGAALVALREQVAGRLGQTERDHAVEHGRHDADEEHPAPRLEAEQQLLRGAVGAVEAGEERVGEQGGEDAERDRELLQRAETAAHVRRHDLRDVGGRDDGGDADAEAADHAPDHEVDDAEGEAGAERADQEEDRADQHRAGAADPVRDPAGEVGAERAAEQGDRDGEALQRRVQLELLADRVDGAVDDGGVETEEEPAERTRDREPRDLPLQLLQARRLLPVLALLGSAHGVCPDGAALEG